MQQLHNLERDRGSRRARKRIGRGESSGHGKTAGRGGKGQTARVGKGKPKPGFEGGQTPMYRRMPKRGFTNVLAIPRAEVNLRTLMAHFPAGAEVDLAALKARGLARGRARQLRVLGVGDVDHPLVVRADHISEGARAKLLAGGGRVDLTGER